jgi:hypothetical protein
VSLLSLFSTSMNPEELIYLFIKVKGRDGTAWYEQIIKAQWCFKLFPKNTNKITRRKVCKNT